MTEPRDIRIRDGFTLGVALAFGWAVGTVGLSLSGAVLNITGVGNLVPRDDTDSQKARSGVRLVTDYGTGCQYLKTREGHITPRLKPDGLPACDG